MRIVLVAVLLVLAALPLVTTAQAPPPIRIGFGSAMSGPAANTGEGV
jgi:hypothetical protein